MTKEMKAMDKKLQLFLESNLLDLYIIGATSPEENKEVEYFINNYEQAKLAYIEGQNNLEILAKASAIEPSKTNLNTILKEINSENAIHKNEEEGKVISMHTKTRTTPWYSIAASVAAFLFATIATSLYFNNAALKSENQVVVDEIFDLRSDIKKTNSQLNELMLQFQKLNNPDAQKYVLRGNERAQKLETVAYINPVEKTSMLDIISLPQLPEDQCYQIWAEMTDRMVSLGIIDPRDAKLKPLPYLEDALAITITIEPKGGNVTTSPEREVAEISLNQ